MRFFLLLFKIVSFYLHVVNVYFHFVLADICSNIDLNFYRPHFGFLKALDQDITKDFGGRSKSIFALLRQGFLVKNQAKGRFANTLCRGPISRISLEAKVGISSIHLTIWLGFAGSSGIDSSGSQRTNGIGDSRTRRHQKIGQCFSQVGRPQNGQCQNDAELH